MALKSETRTVAARGRSPLVARECWVVGGIAAIVVFGALLAVGAGGRHGFYGPSDAPSFLAVARSPFGTGHPFPGDPRVQGVAYRYGRVFFPFVGWVLALGRPVAVKWSLAITFVLSYGAWVALAGEHLRRGGRDPRLGLLVCATPWAVLWFFVPEVVSEPMAGALLLLSYLYVRDGRDRPARVAAALAILTREFIIVAFVPLAWRAWKERRWRGLRDWALVVVPYALWMVWVRVRVGRFPFLDPASNRRDAFALPLAGWYRTATGPLTGGRAVGLLVAAMTLIVVAFVAARGNWQYPVTHGAVALAALSLCYGVSVFAFLGEATRVIAPTQVLLLIAICDRSRSVARRRDAGGLLADPVPA